MKVAVYDSHVTTKSGGIMHFDIIVPEATSHEKVLEFGRDYLRRVGQEGQSLGTRECEFCHTEEARLPVERSIHDRGFHIVEMEGCRGNASSVWSD